MRMSLAADDEYHPRSVPAQVALRCPSRSSRLWRAWSPHVSPPAVPPRYAPAAPAGPSVGMAHLVRMLARRVLPPVPSVVAAWPGGQTPVSSPDVDICHRRLATSASAARGNRAARLISTAGEADLSQVRWSGKPAASKTGLHGGQRDVTSPAAAPGGRAQEGGALMSGKAFRLDMTMMYAMHHALRRELERIARITARPDDDPRHVLATAAGWEMFKTYLRVHHTSEDDAVWPVMQQALAGWPGDLALLEAMEAEHAAIDPLLNAMDAALADREGGPQRLGGLAAEALTAPRGPVRHEESKALPLIDATMTQQQCQHFGEVHRNRIGTGLPRYLPWLLEGTSAQDTEAVLSRLPQDLLIAYQDQWRPAYAQLDLWGTRHEPVTP